MSGPRCPTMYEPAIVDEAEAAEISSGLSTASHCGSAGAHARVLFDDTPRQSGWAASGAQAQRERIRYRATHGLKRRLLQPPA